eukprot:SAG11_NODE_21756_length_419_cov_0.975000_1_plen_102_part_10
MDLMPSLSSRLSLAHQTLSQPRWFRHVYRLLQASKAVAVSRRPIDLQHHVGAMLSKLHQCTWLWELLRTRCAFSIPTVPAAHRKMGVAGVARAPAANQGTVT